MAIKVEGDPCPRFVAVPRALVNTSGSVNTHAVNTKVDRHAPGYMAEYMRKRRAAQKAK
jgi:hypothetical protein